MTAYTFDQLITFTRTSAATYVGSNGLVAVTPASRNLLIYTQEFDNAAWSKSNATVTANSATAPDGTLTGDTLVPNNGASDGQTTQVVASVSVSTAYAYSFYVKSAGLNSARFRLTARTAGNVFVSDLQVDADLSSGTVGAVTSGTFTGTSASITSVGGGWYRVSLIGTTPATTAILWASVRYPPAGDGTSGFYIWGAQLEAASAASTYTRNNGGVYPPRFDYDPVTRAPRGLLIEEQRTNLLTYSEEFDNASWTKTGATVTANATTSPDGTVDADKLVETATTGVHSATQVAATTSTGYTFSVYLKAGERTFALLFHAQTNAAQVINLSTGALAGNAGLSAPTSSSVTSVGNGWYRVSITVTATATGNSFRVYPMTDTSTYSYTGDGTSGIYLWGAQLEAGAFATSYIPTVASQVTRTADLAAITAPMFAPWYRQSEGTLVVQAVTSKPTSVAATGLAVDVSDGGISNRHYIGVVSASAEARTVVGGVNQALIIQAYTANAIEKYGYAVKENDFAFYRNGSQAGLDTTGSMPTVNRMFIGNAAGSAAFWNGHIQSIDYYPTRLTNAQIQALTA